MRIKANTDICINTQIYANHTYMKMRGRKERILKVAPGT